MKTILILLGFLLSSLFSSSASLERMDNIYFDRFSNEDGLSHSTILDIKQDPLGYIWIASGNGLNRYDGNRFTVYKKDQKNPNSLLENATSCLFVDSKNQLWVGSRKGLSCLDQSRSRFTNYPLLNGATFGNIHAIAEIGESQYLVGGNRGLFLFSPQEGYVKIRTNLSREIFHSFVSYQGRLIVGGAQGLFYYVPESRTIVPVDDRLPVFNVNEVLFFDRSKEKLWIATEDSGLILYDFVTRSYVQYRKGDISSDRVRAIAYDSSLRLWIGSYEGLDIYDPDSRRFVHLPGSSNREGEISQNSVRRLLLDNQGGIWCGTYFGGINYYHPLKRQIKHFKHSFAHWQETLSNNVVSAIGEDSRGRIWIGTNDGGINLFDPTSERFVIPARNPALGVSSVKAFQTTADGSLWIGSYVEGLLHCDPATMNIRRIHLSDFASDSQIYSLAAHGDTLFVGSVSGVFCYHYPHRRVSSLATKEGQVLDKVVNTLWLDSRKRLWIGTPDGYFCYDLPTASLVESVTAIQQEGFENTNAFEQDSRGRIWIGTNNSLTCLNPDLSKNEQMSQYFSGTAVYAILHDTNSRLWITTTEGLYTLNLISGQKVLYTTANGVQGNQFMRNSSLRSSDGRFYFGGINGFNRFSPELIIDNPYTPAPIIEGITLFNQRVLPQNDLGVVYRTDEHSGISEIRIPGKYPNFRIQTVVTNFLSGQGNNLFAYQLQGLDREWKQTRTGEIVYSNLSPGEYRLLVKCANSSLVWNTRPTELRLIILPQWYQTWWARILFLLLAVGLIYLVGRTYLNRRLMKQKLTMEQDKLRFFINISHEFRTPLSMIISPLEDLLRRGIKERWLHKQITLVYRNAVRMLELVNHTLDYRRSQMGALEFKVAEGDPISFLDKTTSLFAASCERRGIDFSFRASDLAPKILFSAAYLDRIVTNLVSNAIKFTPQGGAVSLSVSTNGRRLIVRVIDTGCGIPKEKQTHIFDRFYQVEENATGSGIGLSFVQALVSRYRGEIEVESEVAHGSCFTVQLPYLLDQFTADEIVTDTVREETAEWLTLEQAEQLIESSLPADPILADSLPIPTVEGAPTIEKTILVVEDSPDIRDYLYDHFSAQYRVLVAHDGQEAFSIVEQTPGLDLIISDVMMPRMDGIELCRLLKQNINYCHIPLFLLTAKSELHDQLRGITIGADDYISKPFVMALLQAKVENLFKQRSRLVRHYASAPNVAIEEVTANPLDAKLLNKATRIVLQRMSDPEFSVEQLGREVGMSRSNLHYKIKNLTGDTAIEFIRRIRMNEAKRLLRERRMSILEISTYIGFTPSYFSTSFKKFAGVLPKEYQEHPGE